MALKSRVSLYIALTVLAILAIAVLASWRLNAAKWISYTPKTALNSGMRGITGSSITHVPIQGRGIIRVDSIAEAEKQTGLPLKTMVPQRMFGYNAQVFLSEQPVGPSGRRGVTISYTNKAEPMVADGFINIAWRDPGLASYAMIVEQKQKEGSPYALYEHKGHPGYTLEKGMNDIKGNMEPRPAIVVWLDGNTQYSIVGPEGKGLSELLPIADSID